MQYSQSPRPPAPPPAPAPPRAGDGAVSREDMELIMRQMGGSSLSDAEVRALALRVFDAAGAPPTRGLTLAEFGAALEGGASQLSVEVPVDD